MLRQSEERIVQQRISKVKRGKSTMCYGNAKRDEEVHELSQLLRR